MSMLVIYKYILVLHTCASVSTFAPMLPLATQTMCLGLLVLECKGKKDTIHQIVVLKQVYSLL